MLREFPLPIFCVRSRFAITCAFLKTFCIVVCITASSAEWKRAFPADMTQYSRVILGLLSIRSLYPNSRPRCIEVRADCKGGMVLLSNPVGLIIPYDAWGCVVRTRYAGNGPLTGFKLYLEYNRKIFLLILHWDHVHYLTRRITPSQVPRAHDPAYKALRMVSVQN